MKLKFTFLNSILGCISLLLINTKFTFNVAAEEPLEVYLALIVKRETQPKNKFKKVNLSFIS